MLLISKGVREWAEILGIMTDKETQGDEEVLIYAMTLINKVFILYWYIYQINSTLGKSVLH